MATPAHTPHGRGTSEHPWYSETSVSPYDISLNYFSHNGLPINGLPAVLTRCSVSGYDTSLNYFSHKNDFWSQANMQTCCEPDQTIIDFWHTDRGASDVNSTGYSEFLYRGEKS